MRFNAIPHLKNVPASGKHTVYVKLDMESDQIENERAPMRLACVFDRCISARRPGVESSS